MHRGPLHTMGGFSCPLNDVWIHIRHAAHISDANPPCHNLPVYLATKQTIRRAHLLPAPIWQRDAESIASLAIVELRHCILFRAQGSRSMNVLPPSVNLPDRGEVARFTAMPTASIGIDNSHCLCSAASLPSSRFHSGRHAFRSIPHNRCNILRIHFPLLD